MADLAISTDTPVKDTAVAPENTSIDPLTGTVNLDTSAPAKAVVDTKPVWEQHGFKSADEMGKAYGELRTKMSKDGAPKPPEAPAKVEDKKTDAPELTAAQKIIAEKITTDVQSVVGGADEYKILTDWAAANQTPAERKAFDDAVQSGNVDLAKLAVKGLFADYAAAVGTDGSLVGGGAAPATSGIKPFESQAQIVDAMRDPRWKNHDPAYVKEVERRLERTDYSKI